MHAQCIEEMLFNVRFVDEMYLCYSFFQPPVQCQNIAGVSYPYTTQHNIIQLLPRLSRGDAVLLCRALYVLCLAL